MCIRDRARLPAPARRPSARHGGLGRERAPGLGEVRMAGGRAAADRPLPGGDRGGRPRSVRTRRASTARGGTQDLPRPHGGRGPSRLREASRWRSHPGPGGRHGPGRLREASRWRSHSGPRAGRGLGRLREASRWRSHSGPGGGHGPGRLREASRWRSHPGPRAGRGLGRLPEASRWRSRPGGPRPRMVSRRPQRMRSRSRRRTSPRCGSLIVASSTGKLTGSASVRTASRRSTSPSGGPCPVVRHVSRPWPTPKLS